MNWSVRGTGAQAFTAATPADLLREMAEFVDEWTENDASGTRFVADVSIRFGGDSATPWEGIVYTDSTEHLDLLLAQQREWGKSEGADATGASAFAVAGTHVEPLFEEAGQVVNIGHVNVYLGEA